MVTKEELEIVNVFRKNPLKNFTFKEIMFESKKKSRNWVFNVLKNLTSNYVLLKEPIGNNFVYKANLRNSMLLSYFQIWDFNDAHINNSKLPFDLILDILGSVKKITPFFILLVFGSYTDKSNKKTSDLDLAFIVDSTEIKKRIMPYIERITRKNIKSVDYQIITKEEFKEMLLREEENLGKEIFRKHILIWGNNAYYELIRQAEENGFKG